MTFSDFCLFDLKKPRKFYFTDQKPRKLFHFFKVRKKIYNVTNLENRERLFYLQ